MKTAYKKLNEIAGSWKMSDKEAEEMFTTLRKGWSRWKMPFLELYPCKMAGLEILNQVA